MICRCCRKSFFNRYVAIERRIERLESAANHFICHVLTSDTYPLWCSDPCWKEEGVAFFYTLGFSHLYPETSSESLCAFCSKPVDRLKPYVCYVMTDIESDEKPWLTTGIVHDEETIAVVCPDCEPTDQSRQEVLSVRERLYATLS
jgi:hypothetical protein